MKRNTARSDCLLFARYERLEAKGDKHGVTLFDPRTEWVLCFDGWKQLYGFLCEASRGKNDRGLPYPWDTKRQLTTAEDSWASPTVGA